MRTEAADQSVVPRVKSRGEGTGGTVSHWITTQRRGGGASKRPPAMASAGSGPEFGDGVPWAVAAAGSTEGGIESPRDAAANRWSSDAPATPASHAARADAAARDLGLVLISVPPAGSRRPSCL